MGSCKGTHRVLTLGVPYPCYGFIAFYIWLGPVGKLRVKMSAGGRNRKVYECINTEG